MAWVTPQYSKSKVNQAGETLNDLNEKLVPKLEALEVINNWRSSHNFPLNTFQIGLRQHSKQVDAASIVAQRIKRLSSIRLKLSRFPTMTLSQMQDIGGCRAILPGANQVEVLVASYLGSDLKHELAQVDDYIFSPKKSGYRSVHLIYKYYSDRKETYNGLKIEIQIRSSLQHAWATAVETVGTFTRQSLKSSTGEEDWLRFFALMSSAIAIREKRPPVPDTPILHGSLRKELNHYIKLLDVESHLRAYGNAVRTIGEKMGKTGDQYYLLQLNPTTKTLSIQSYRQRELPLAAEEYLAAETASPEIADAVLVSVDSVAALRRAYPNYFLDTHIFIDAMHKAMRRDLASGA